MAGTLAPILDDLNGITIRIAEGREPSEPARLPHELVEDGATLFKRPPGGVQILHTEDRSAAGRRVIGPVQRQPDRPRIELGPALALAPDEREPDHIAEERHRGVHVTGPVVDLVQVADDGFSPALTLTHR